MRRTTISRFRRAALLALVAVPLVAWGLAAQDTTKLVSPSPDTTPSLQSLPSTHTVTQGETLWTIAQLYFNDPLLWPEIFRLNTAAIQDPHWIYPGQVLNVSSPVAATIAPPAPVAQGTPAPAPAESVQAQPAADTVAAVPAAPAAPVAPVDTTTRDTTQTVAVAPPPPPPPPVEDESYETIFDHPQSEMADVRRVLRSYADQPYRPVRRGEFYSAGFLTENERLPWGDVVGTTETSAIPRLTDRTTAYEFEQIVIEPPAGASYHVNDSLLVANITDDEGRWGQVVVPTGVARVLEVGRRQLLAELVTQFGPVHGGQHVLPLEPFKDPGEVTPTPVDQGLQGHVIAPRESYEIATSMQVVFIDRGRAEGVVPGDIFEIYTGRPGTPSAEQRAVMEIVHTREHTASALLLRIENPQILPGLPVRLIRKMPS
jgi:LysM repeat protein